MSVISYVIIINSIYIVIICSNIDNSHEHRQGRNHGGMWCGGKGV